MLLPGIEHLLSSLKAFPVVAGSKLISYVLDSTLKMMFEETDSRLAGIEGRIGNIQQVMEWQNAAPLRAAISYMRIQEHVKARDELIRAEATDPRGAVARVLLGRLLAKEGKHDAATERFWDALLINPFALQIIDPSLLTGMSQPSHSSVTWAATMTDKSYFKGLKRLGFWERLSGERDQWALARMGHCGGTLVISWYSTPHSIDDDTEGTKLLSSVEASSGRCLWSRNADKESLILVTPRFVVTERASTHGHYIFTDSVSGSPQGEMIGNYFRTSFCPNWDEVRSSREFTRGHQEFTTARAIEDRWDRSERERVKKLDWLRWWFDGGQGMATVDTRIVSDVLGEKLGRYAGHNRWEGSFSSTTTSSGAGSTNKILKCTGGLNRQS